MTSPAQSLLPRHVAIIMDGNGRWAERRRRPRAIGHKAGQDAAEKIITTARERGVEVLTLFAFSSENWQRPVDEVRQLFSLLAVALERQIDRLIEGEIRLRFIGDTSGLSASLQESMRKAEARTADFRGMQLNVAVSYGGRWDMVQAVQRIAQDVASGDLDPRDIDEAALAARLVLGDIPDPDLFIRTGGESRISNFLLWNLAYTELCFSDCLWPDFDAVQFDAALEWFAGRQRRFGCIPGTDTGSGTGA
ncbi:MAG TPA: polyprenyl diphosphate synthase [Gammaproteobacteria bacterium]